MHALFRSVFLSLTLALAPLLAAPALAQSAPDRAAIEAIIKEYLIKHPEIIQEALAELDRRQRDEEAQALKKITGDFKGPLYVSSHHTVVGNPEGDVTLVEFFDFNCGYCKRGLADIEKLLATDKKLRVVLKEFPILSPGSRDAAMVALALREQFDRSKLWKFHADLLATRGQVGKEQARELAQKMGADMTKLDKDAQAPKIAAALEESQKLAEAIGINGTPTYIVAGEIVVGARGYEALAASIEAMRKCGKSTC